MKLIILDRDGVINEDSDDYIKSPEEWIPIPGSLDAVTRLNQAGYRVVVASNQSGIARGLFDMDTLIAINRKMHTMLAQHGARIDAVFFCPHKSGCRCRKPLPGLFMQIAARFRSELGGVPAVGDSVRDAQAAQAAGAAPLLVRTGKGETALASGKLPAGIAVYDDLAAVADALAAGSE